MILPATFVGSPRSQIQNFQDVIAIVRHYKKPDFFITFTCNPQWPEIKENLKDGEEAWMRPDLAARVFNLKMESLFEDLYKKNVLGKHIAHAHAVEFQKRGLPHCHILLFVAQEDKPTIPEAYDRVISAEIPDITKNPVLHSIVTSNLIHGPCGIDNMNSPCMQSANVLKNFQKNTVQPVQHLKMVI